MRLNRDALAPEGVADEYPGMAIASELFDVADVQGFDEAWQRYSALFAPLLAPQEEGQGLEQAAA